jgi:putative ABC transport system ATP-binding protein
VLQAFHLIPTMTALENVGIPLELAGIAEPEVMARAELVAVGLGHRLDHYPTQLSGGEQQRVGLARAIAARPALIFADEPTGNLDEATGEAVIELLFGRLADTGATLVLITHDAALAARCDRIIEMKDGHIVRDTRRDAVPVRAVAE